MNVKKQLISNDNSDPVTRDLYTNERDINGRYISDSTHEKKISYEQIYLVLLTGLGLLFFCSYILLNQQF